MKQKLYLSPSFAFFAGCVAALGQAPWSLWFLTITGFFFSFCILKVCRNYKEASLTGFFTGLGYFLVSLFWIMEPFLIPGSSHKWLAPFALFGLSAGLSLFWLVAYGVTTYDDDREVTEDPDYGVVKAKKVTWGLDDIPGDAEF